MKETIMYCQEFTRPDGEKFHTHFYSHPKASRMCNGKHPVLKARVREIQEGEESTYWAWWGFGKGDPKFLFCYARKTLLKMCFPYGMKAAEEHGDGVSVNVIIEILEEVENV